MNASPWRMAISCCCPAGPAWPLEIAVTAIDGDNEVSRDAIVEAMGGETQLVAKKEINRPSTRMATSPS